MRKGKGNSSETILFYGANIKGEKRLKREKFLWLKMNETVGDDPEAKGMKDKGK